MNISDIKHAASASRVHMDLVPGRYVAHIDIAAPGALTDQRILNAALRRGDDHTKERRQRPAHLAADIHNGFAVTVSPRGARNVANDRGEGFVDLPEFAHAGQGTRALKASRPTPIPDRDLFDIDDERVTWFDPIDVDRATDRIAPKILSRRDGRVLKIWP